MFHYFDDLASSKNTQKRCIYQELSIHPTDIISDAEIGFGSCNVAGFNHCTRIISTSPCWSLWYEKITIYSKNRTSQIKGVQRYWVKFNQYVIGRQNEASISLLNQWESLFRETLAYYRNMRNSFVLLFFLGKSYYPYLQSKFTSSDQPVAYICVLAYFTCIRYFKRQIYFCNMHTKDSMHAQQNNPTRLLCSIQSQSLVNSCITQI